MRTILLSLTVFTFFTSAAYAQTINVSVMGMVCDVCAKKIEETFKKEKAVNSIKVDLAKKLLTLHTKSDESFDDQKIKTLVTGAGYSVTGITREK